MTKTHSGAKKRFKITAGGKIKRAHSGAAHLKSKKSPEQRRRLRSSVICKGKVGKNIKRLLGN
jgi:large subunit ribosomal protein L35